MRVDWCRDAKGMYHRNRRGRPGSHDILLSLDDKLVRGRKKETFPGETGQFTYIELVDELLNGPFVASEVLGCR